MKRRMRECAKEDCFEPPHLGGLCEKHHKEKAERERRCEAALDALHFGKIADRVAENHELRDELFQLRQWWFKVCQSIISEKDEMLGDEAKHASEWCIALAQEIVDAEIAFRAGNSTPSHSLITTREWVWERFHNLETGLMSNGAQREIK